MKKTITLLVLFLIVKVSHSQDNEKRIKFNAGTLKICTSAHMKIKGYDGDEVIIKSLNNQTRYIYNFNYGDSNNGKLINSSLIKSDSIKIKGYRYLTFSGKEKELEKGLKPLGNKSNNPADNLYLDITENSGELIIRDYNQSESNTNLLSRFSFDNKYEITIPNTIKLLWNTEQCSKTNANTFFVTSGSQPSELSNFKGEVEISLSYGSINITDVSGPVIANTIGGNIKVIFDKIVPTELYSLISNNGYIDVELPTTANLNVDAKGNRILSDIDFEVLTENITSSINGTKEMKLKLNSGGTKMKLDAGSGSIYIREHK
nr:hypothetical protein [uncultured Psychroserpens sp.]